MVLHRLDDSILEIIVSKLPPSALARAELVCTSWGALITRAQLWEQHAKAGSSSGISSCCQATSSSSSSSSSSSRDARPAEQPWRDITLHRAAADKWCNGRLTISATMMGHSGPVTCIGVLDNIAITGSTDGTARVWDLVRSTQQHVLQMPGRECVVAVALPSVSLAVTATARGGAVLWRAGAAIRRFQPMPGGRVAAVALTDTQLLLGSTAGVVQYFDVFSGQQQLITRNSSGVACLHTYKQQQQQHQETGLESEEWLTLVGCVDGQVSCVSSATGRLLWQLPTRHPAKVVGMQLVFPQPSWQPPPAQQPQQPQRQKQKQQQPRQQHGKGIMQRQRQRPVHQPVEHLVLLYVMNARSQVICWQLPWAALDSNAAAAAAAAALPTSRQVAFSGTPGASSSARHSSKGAVHGRLNEVSGQQAKMPHWPLSVCSVAAPIQQRQPRQPQQQVDGQPAGKDHQQQQQQQAMRQFAHVPHNSSTCLLSPLYGLDCLLVGSSLGHLTVAQLKQQGAPCPATEAVSAAAAAAAGNVNAAAAAGARGAPGATDSSAVAAGTQPAEGSVILARDGPTHSASPAAATGSTDAPAAVTEAIMQPGPRLQGCALVKQDPASQHSTPRSCEVAVVRHCSLHKLGRMLAGRQAASTAVQRNPARATPAPAPASSGRYSTGEPGSRGGVEPEVEVGQVQEHLLDGCKVCCMQWGPGGQLLAGLGSGHVCCLKFKHPAKSVWA